MNQASAGQSSPYKNEKNSVKRVLLEGVFWRILIIEGILLAGSLLYRLIAADAGLGELSWYAMRIIFLIAIIIAFMMITLRSFLTRRIILPLETIAEANRRLQLDDPKAREILNRWMQEAS